MPELGELCGRTLQPCGDARFDLGSLSRKWRQLFAGKAVLGGGSDVRAGNVLYVEGDPGSETGEPQVHIYNPTNAAGSFAGLRLRTASGWDVRLGTVQDKYWLVLTGSGGEVKHKWVDTDYYSGTHYPLADNAYDLGSGTLRWRKVYATDVSDEIRRRALALALAVE